jgi:hypothetical protein
LGEFTEVLLRIWGRGFDNNQGLRYQTSNAVFVHFFFGGGKFLGGGLNTK